jgi:hypothetical protein
MCSRDTLQAYLISRGLLMDYSLCLPVMIILSEFGTQPQYCTFMLINALILVDRENALKFFEDILEECFQRYLIGRVTSLPVVLWMNLFVFGMLKMEIVSQLSLLTRSQSHLLTSVQTVLWLFQGATMVSGKQLQFHFIPTQSYFLSSRIWDTNSGQCLRTLLDKDNAPMYLFFRPGIDAEYCFQIICQVLS